MARLSFSLAGSLRRFLLVFVLRLIMRSAGNLDRREKESTHQFWSLSNMHLSYLAIADGVAVDVGEVLPLSYVVRRVTDDHPASLVLAKPATKAFLGFDAIDRCIHSVAANGARKVDLLEHGPVAVQHLAFASQRSAGIQVSTGVEAAA